MVAFPLRTHPETDDPRAGGAGAAARAEPVVTPQAALPPARAMRGIGLVLLASVFLSASDVSSKVMTAALPPVEVNFLRFCAFAGIMAAVSLARGPGRLTTRMPGLQVLRALGMVSSSALFITALVYLPIADATAMTFVTPILAMALSALLLGERVGPGRWCAAIVGFLGVLIVVRPGLGGFQWAALIAVASSLCWAGTLVITRKMSATEDPLTTLTLTAVIGLAVLAVAVPFVWVPPSLGQVALGGFIGLASCIGHWLVILAYRHAGATLLAPFSYVQLLWASLFGFILFSVLPDLWTLAGAVVIALSGLYIVQGERRGPSRV